MRYFVLPALLGLSACMSTIPEDGRGSVYQFNSETVTIRGGFDASRGAAKPTPQMIEQAREVCPNATYLSANPTPSDTYTFLYLFRC